MTSDSRPRVPSGHSPSSDVTAYNCLSCQGWPTPPRIRSRSSHSCFEALRIASKQEWLLRLRNPPVNLALLVLLLLYGSCRFGHPEGSERPNISPWSNPAYTVTAQTTYDREFPFLGQRPAGQCQSQCCNVRGRGL